MKTKKQLPKLVSGVLTGALLTNALVLSSFAPAKTKPGKEEDDDRAGRNRIVRKRAGKKSRQVKIYPDLLKKVMHVVSRDVNDSVIDFYVFALDGTLMVNHRLNPGDHVLITDLEKGAYRYEVFDGDEMTEKGNLDIR